MPSTDRATASWLLFLVPTFIWSTTWLVIKFQLGAVAPDVSVAYRFALAAIILFGWCLLQRIPLGFDLRTHAGLAVLGMLLFGFNYVLVYVAERHLASGLVAVVFALIVVWNILGARLLLGSPTPSAVLVGSALGLLGVTLVFWPEVAGIGRGPQTGFGLSVAVLGSLLASSGNLVSQRLYARGVAVVPSTPWAMLYASAAVALSCVVRGIPFTFDASFPYLASLAYLSVFGSVIAFISYLTLLRRVGAGRAGYTNAVIPVLAMLVSTAFEGYRWTGLALAGTALVVAGNVLVLRGREAAARPAS